MTFYFDNKAYVYLVKDGANTSRIAYEISRKGFIDVWMPKEMYKDYEKILFPKNHMRPAIINIFASDYAYNILKDLP